VFQLSAFRYACGEGCEWFADVVHFFGGVLMVLVGLASTSPVEFLGIGAQLGSKANQYVPFRARTSSCAGLAINID